MLEAATLNAAIALIASVNPQTELEALFAVLRGRRGNKQTFEVRHVHIHPGGQGVVGIINSLKDGISGGKTGSTALDSSPGSESQHNAKPIAHAPEPRCGARTRSRRSCQAPAMPNGRCRMHGGTSPGAPKGN